MKRLIVGGVRSSDEGFVMDYTIDLPSDIIDLVSPELYKTSYRNHIYWFGYKFKDEVSSKLRTEFIHYIKGLGVNKIEDHELTQFIEKPLGVLDKQFNIYNIDCLVYPISNRSRLVNKIVQVTSSYTSRDKSVASYELVKQTPTEIAFDWSAFEADNAYDSNKYKQMCEYVNTQLIPKIKGLDYFSLANAVKPKYRKYIKDYLGFVTQADLERFAKVQGDNILIIDDINTSGATLDEILNVLNKVNHNSNIFIFTLLGNFM